MEKIYYEKPLKTTVRLNEKTVDILDRIVMLNPSLQNHNAAIIKAIQMYHSMLMSELCSEYLIKLYDLKIKPELDKFKEDISKTFYKVALEQGIQTTILSKEFEIPDKLYEKIRDYVKDEITLNKGVIEFG